MSAIRATDTWLVEITVVRPSFAWNVPHFIEQIEKEKTITPNIDWLSFIFIYMEFIIHAKADI